MFIDLVKIFVKSGNGGNGCLSFHREKYVQSGGPDGGNGGNGGDVVLVADPELRTLLDFHFQKHFSAGDGGDGRSNMRTGSAGADVEIRVPCGTIVKDSVTGLVAADMFHPGDRRVILRGGRGGRGNASFASAKLHAPNFAQDGEITKQHELLLEMKTIADVGLVGFPNVGKSTILSVISKARPKIANYPFTTLQPNLGVVRCDDESFVTADIPGLIEGAADGAGLGHDFLRHVERTRAILHVVDASGSEGRDPAEDYLAINRELEAYSPALASRPQIILANKMELPGAQEGLERLKTVTGDTPVYPVSAATNTGFTAALRAVNALLHTLPAPEPLTDGEEISYHEDPNQFEIVKLSADLFEIRGNLTQQLLRKVNFEDHQSLDYFQRQLREKGVIAALRKRGAKDGSVIRMEELEFDFVD